LLGIGNCLFPAKALPAAFFTKAPEVKALAEIDTEAAKAKVTKALFAIVILLIFLSSMFKKMK
jgi:hypothetical protein